MRLPLRTLTSLTTPSWPITAFRLTFPVRAGFPATGYLNPLFGASAICRRSRGAGAEAVGTGAPAGAVGAALAKTGAVESGAGTAGKTRITGEDGWLS